MYGFNNQYQQGYGAPYMGQYGQASQQACQITRVNGRNGADAFRMAPNSSILLLDENDPIDVHGVTGSSPVPRTKKVPVSHETGTFSLLLSQKSSAIL